VRPQEPSGPAGERPAPASCLQRLTDDRPRSIGGSRLRDGALHNLRSAQGVIRLADKYGPVRLEAACRRAVEVGDPGYRTIKGILVAGTETECENRASVPEAPAHLHGQQSLFSHLDEEETAG
jgi:hypothetical protein